MCKYTLIQEEQRAALAHVETVMWTKAPFYIKTVENIFFSTGVTIELEKRQHKQRTWDRKVKKNYITKPSAVLSLPTYKTESYRNTFREETR